MIFRRMVFATAAVVLGLSLVGCGGGSNDVSVSPPQELVFKVHGVAATDAPISGGRVELLCFDPSVQRTVYTDERGNWVVDVPGNAFPCAVRATGGFLANDVAIYSVALGAGTTNISVLTDILTSATVGQLPSSWWADTKKEKFHELTQERLSAALSSVRQQFGLAELQSVDPVSAPYDGAAKMAIDDIHQALDRTLPQWAAQGLSYEDLLKAVSDPAHFVLAENLRLILQQAYSSVTGGGNGPHHPSGVFNLTISSTVLNQNYGGPVLVQGVSLPQSADKFCEEVSQPASKLFPGQFLPSGWQFQSCSYVEEGTMRRGFVVVTVPDSTYITGYRPTVLNYTYG